ncbi:hypothetical protein ILUMI_10252 [Ignelater luminosus]|uniref:PiggyBac transposable element-derived protein domain-containing protein n=1 Tax=Ignelater luminosus TaxID=2038154 RepID=A0A8K0D2E6_IGNLU|nr:hypothetical protein ILUMI_10252 [Ignelater luminosus]
MIKDGLLRNYVPESELNYDKPMVKYGKILWSSRIERRLMENQQPHSSTYLKIPKNVQNLPYDFYFDNLFTNLLAFLRHNRHKGTDTMRKNRVPKSCLLNKKKFIMRSGKKGVHNSIIEKKMAEKRYVQVPRQYNSGMDGKNLMDEDINKYRIGIRSKKWWWCLFTWLIDVIIDNAWILQKQSEKNLSQLEFKRESLKLTSYVMVEKTKLRTKRYGSGGFARHPMKELVETVLIQEEERYTVETIVFTAECGYTINREDLKYMIRGRNSVLGKERAEGLSQFVVDEFFKIYQNVLEVNNLNGYPERIFNLDKTELGTDSTKGKVFMPKTARTAYSRSGSAGKLHYSVLFVATANGQRFPPCVGLMHLLIRAPGPSASQSIIVPGPSAGQPVDHANIPGSLTSTNVPNVLSPSPIKKLRDAIIQTLSPDQFQDIQAALKNSKMKR